MPAPPTDCRVRRGEVLAVRPSGEDGVVLALRPSPVDPLVNPPENPPVRAGRFFMLRREDALSPAIPRPFSVYREREGGVLEFLIKVVGPGTRALSTSAVGTRVLTVGPLGAGWPTLDGDGAPWVMIGGGIGSAPFYMAIQQALQGMHGAGAVPASHLTFLYGGRRAGFLYDLDEFTELGVRVLAATDDGSLGFHGNVVECLEQQWERGDLPDQVRILTCGPEPMMRAVARVAADRGLRCWLSLETLMGCGVGICNGCAVETVEGGALGKWPVAKCCVDGPVFAASDIRI